MHSQREQEQELPLGWSNVCVRISLLLFFKRTARDAAARGFDDRLRKRPCAATSLHERRFWAPATAASRLCRLSAPVSQAKQEYTRGQNRVSNRKKTGGEGSPRQFPAAVHVNPYHPELFVGVVVAEQLLDRRQERTIRLFESAPDLLVPLRGDQRLKVDVLSALRQPFQVIDNRTLRQASPFCDLFNRQSLFQECSGLLVGGTKAVPIVEAELFQSRAKRSLCASEMSCEIGYTCPGCVLVFQLLIIGWVPFCVCLRVLLSNLLYVVSRFPPIQQAALARVGDDERQEGLAQLLQLHLSNT